MAEDIIKLHRYSDLALHRHQWGRAGLCTILLCIVLALRGVMAASTRTQESVMGRGQWDGDKVRLDTQHIKDKDKGWTQDGINNKRDQDKDPL